MAVLQPLWVIIVRNRLEQFKPICLSDDLASEHQENYQKDQTATAASAGSASPESKTMLEPIKQPIQ